MKIFLTILVFTLQIFGSNNSEVPQKYKNEIRIYEPANKLITIKNDLKIKGRVKPGIKVFVENKEVELDNNNQFYYSMNLTKLGKQEIKIEFQTSNDKFSVIRNIIKLKNPKSVIMTQKELAFINTKYTSPRIKKLSLSNTFKKDEFAYFLDKIKITNSYTEKKVNNLNKIKNYKTEIQETVNSNILAVNSRGNFNPNAEVNRLFFLAGIAKALEYKESNTKYSEIEKYKNKWLYKFLKIGLDKKIITVSDLKKIREPLNHAEFIKLAVKIPELEEKINNELAFENTVIKKENKQIKKAAQKDQLTTIKILNVYNKTSTSKEIRGIVQPAKSFVLNWRKVVPNQSGYFTAKIPANQEVLKLNFGNEVIAQELKANLDDKKVVAQKKQPELIENTERLDIKRENGIEPYNDLSSHWIKAIANELKLEGKLDNTDQFEPNKKITRADLARYLVNINNLSSNNSETGKFSDIPKTNKNYKYINVVVSNKLLNGMTKTTFSPNGNVTKIQAIIAASRLLPDSKKYENIKLPYNDIGKYKWAKSSLQKAYYYKIISKSAKLFPKKTISNAELVSLLYKTSKI